MGRTRSTAAARSPRPSTGSRLWHIQVTEKEILLAIHLMITVYGVEGKANYNEMEKKVESLKQLAAPFYDIGEAKYSFNEIDKALDTVKALNFPILMNQESAHHFNEIAKV